MHFEGVGDLLACGDILVGGYGFRSDLLAIRHVSEMLDMGLVPLELVDPWFYHVDTCFFFLSDETVFYYPEAFTEAGQNLIKARFRDAIAVSREDARRFVCNAIVVGHQVIMSKDCSRTRLALEARGYTTIELDLSEFLRAGGAAKCLTLFLRRDSVVLATTESYGSGARSHRTPTIRA